MRLLAAIAVATLSAAAVAETGDREKPINYSADRGDLNYETKIGKLDGNVVLTQGTITVRAERLTFRQNPDNSMHVTATGSPVTFRQKRDGSDEYYEGFAQRIEYDGAMDLLELFDRALLKRGPDEIRSNYISYNAKTELFKAEGRPDTPAAAASDSGPGARVRGTFQPREGANLPGKGGDKAAPGGAAPTGPAPKAAAPLTLRPAGEPAPK
ncbi:Lipopolysaccharide export system protein LptA [Burkholderiales bacterium]|nr:Lipopolysaccharide export system protein LptA [Burkholderiales bacterium]